MPHPIDIHLGKKLRHFRKTLQLSQSDLGKSVGITCQQIQKYEHGINRISASKLYQLSLTLHVNIKDFFKDIK